MEKKLCCICAKQLQSMQKRYCSRACYFKKKQQRELDREEALKLSSAAFLHDDLIKEESKKDASLASFIWSAAKMVFIAITLSMLIFISIALNSVLFYFVVAAAMGWFWFNI